jgi:hypothetical protein
MEWEVEFTDEFSNSNWWDGLSEAETGGRKRQSDLNFRRLAPVFLVLMPILFTLLVIRTERASDTTFGETVSSALCF